MKSKVLEAFKTKFGGNPSLFQAPGRINLIGEHTDYNEGFVLPASVNRYIYLAIETRNDNKFHIHSFDFNEDITFTTNTNIDTLPHWAKYPYGVIKEMQAVGAKVEGFNAVFGGNIPSGAGLSSSAALESAFAHAINTIFKNKIDGITLARVGQKAEHNYVGVKCGIMDQFSSIFGRENSALLIDCKTLGTEYIPLNLNDHRIVLTNSNVKHNLASSEYNLRREECEMGVKTISTEFKNVKSLRDVNLEQLKSFKNKLPENVYKRCLYVIEENSRVLKACDMLRTGAIEELGQLLFETHRGLKSLYNVSCDEIDFLVEQSQEIDGVIGSRLMGGGFGGCTISIIKNSSINYYKNTIKNLYYKKFNVEPDFYEVEIGNGVLHLK